MSLTSTIPEKLYCSVCKRKTNHRYLQKDEERGYEDLQWEENFYITRCLGCDTRAFLKEYSDETMYDYDHYTNQMVVAYERTVYPEEPINFAEKTEQLLEIRTFTNVPEFIEMLYSQVVFSYNMKHYLLCAVGLRMIVEAICKELNVEKGKLYILENCSTKINPDGTFIFRKNLEGKINALYDLGVLVWKQTIILHQIRDLGNISAHELVVPKRSTIRSGILVIENILHNIFELDGFQISK